MRKRAKAEAPMSKLKELIEAKQKAMT